MTFLDIKTIYTRKVSKTFTDDGDGVSVRYYETLYQKVNEKPRIKNTQRYSPLLENRIGLSSYNPRNNVPVFLFIRSYVKKEKKNGFLLFLNHIVILAY